YHDKYPLKYDLILNDLTNEESTKLPNSKLSKKFIPYTIINLNYDDHIWFFERIVARCLYDTGFTKDNNLSGSMYCHPITVHHGPHNLQYLSYKLSNQINENCKSDYHSVVEIDN